MSLVRLGVVACTVVTVVLGLVYFFSAIDRLGDDAEQHAAANYDDREFGAGNSLGVDKDVLYAARASIPEDGSYRLVVGASVPGGEDVALFTRSFLMPRRPRPDASWVVCYGCDLSRLGEVQVVWRNDEAGLALGRLTG